MTSSQQTSAAPSRTLLVAVVGLMTLAAATPSRGEQLPAVFEMVPGNSQFVLAIPELDQFNRRMAVLNEDGRLQVPGFADVLDEFRRSTGMLNGVNDKGGFAVAITDLAGMSTDGPPPAIMLVPVSDYGDFVSNFGGNAKAPVTELALPSGVKVFCAQSADFAVLSARRSTVEQFRPGGDTTRFTATQSNLLSGVLASSDASIIIDATATSSQLETFVDSLVEMFADWLVEKYPRVAVMLKDPKALLRGLAADLTRGLVGQSQLVMVGVQIKPEGISFTAGTQYGASSSLSQLFIGQGDLGNILADTPAENFLFARSVNIKAVAMKQIVNNVKSSLESRGLSWFTKSLEGVEVVMDKTQRYAAVSLMPPALGLSAQLPRASVHEMTDGRVFAAAFRNYIQGLDGQKIVIGRLPDALGRINEDQPPAVIAIRTQYTPSALPVDGAQVDQFQIDYSYPPQLLSTMGEASRWLMVLRGTSQRGYVAVANQRVVLTNATDPQFIRNVLEAVKGAKGLGERSDVRAARQMLRFKPAAEIYINPSRVAQMINQLFKIMDVEIEPMELPKGLPLIALGVATDGKSMIARTFVPIEVLRETREPVTDMMREMFAEPEEPELAEGAMGTDGMGRAGDPMGRPNDPMGGRGFGGRGVPTGRGGMPQMAPMPPAGNLVR